MRQTPLNAEHRHLGATLVEFAGWEMPVSYAGILTEVAAVRHAAGLFDVSHMGVLEVAGAGARQSVERLVTCSVLHLREGRARYGLLLNEAGGILDDLLIYALEPDRLWIVCNASNAQRDAEWIEARLGPDAKATRRFGEVAILALQGPRALDIARDATGMDFTGLRRFGFLTWEAGGADLLASRTGYTGEDGIELFCPWSAAPDWWERLMSAGRDRGLLPCGLGARDVLRIEAGNVLYGHEINEDTSPVEANLLWAVNLEKPEFLGRDAVARVQAAGPARLLAGLQMEERAIPRQAAPIEAGGRVVGAVTSGTFSPTLGRGIALGYLPPALAVPGQDVCIDLRGKRRRGTTVALPFVRRR